MKIQAVLLCALSAFLLACDGGGDAGAKPAAKAKSGKPEPVVTATGTHVLAFNFGEDDPCAGCVSSAHEALKALPGVVKNDAEKGKRSFTVEYDPKLLQADALVAALANCGEGVALKVD